MPFKPKCKKIRNSLRRISSVSRIEDKEHYNLIQFGKLLEDELHALRAKKGLIRKMSRKCDKKVGLPDV